MTKTITVSFNDEPTSFSPIDLIEDVYYFTALDGAAVNTEYPEGIQEEHFAILNKIVFCVLILKNGFSVSGEGICSKETEFNAEDCMKLAYKEALDKVYPYMIFMKRQEEFEDELDRETLEGIMNQVAQYE